MLCARPLPEQTGEAALRYSAGLGVRERFVSGQELTRMRLRPCTADGMPVIGFARSTPGLYIATGHAMMGLMLGPITGRIIAADICGHTQSIDPEILAAVRPDRR